MEINNFYIRKNTIELQIELEKLGFVICSCCSYDGSKWLHTYLRGSKREIHGIGEPDGYKFFTEEEVLKYYVNNSGDFDCGTDEELFLSIAKKIGKTKRFKAQLNKEWTPSDSEIEEMLNNNG